MRVTAGFLAVVGPCFVVLGIPLMFLSSYTYSFPPCPIGAWCTSIIGWQFTVNEGTYAGALVAFAGLSLMLAGALRRIGRARHTTYEVVINPPLEVRIRIDRVCAYGC